MKWERFCTSTSYCALSEKPRLAPSTFSSAITSVRPSMNGASSASLITRSSRVTAYPPVLSACLVRGNLCIGGGGASLGAPQRASRASTSAPVRTTRSSANPSRSHGGARRSCFAMLSTAGLPQPYGIVGWATRAATRRVHSAAHISNHTHTASAGLNARSRTRLRSAGDALHRSTSTVRTPGCARALSTTSTSSASNSQREPPRSSCETRTHFDGRDAWIAAQNVDFPAPGGPTSMTKLGGERPVPSRMRGRMSGAACTAAGAGKSLSGRGHGSDPLGGVHMLPRSSSGRGTPASSSDESSLAISWATAQSPVWSWPEPSWPCSAARSTAAASEVRPSFCSARAWQRRPFFQSGRIRVHSSNASTALAQSRWRAASVARSPAARHSLIAASSYCDAPGPYTSDAARAAGFGAMVATALAAEAKAPLPSTRITCSRCTSKTIAHSSMVGNMPDVSRALRAAKTGWARQSCAHWARQRASAPLRL
mmetsp:Transcript_6336/g.16200  ORF Transcript_6336/g.16200 Transcript_6336/m.16200 type:complete len:484 (-) Transcript_6336:458-1909(-)